MVAKLETMQEQLPEWAKAVVKWSTVMADLHYPLIGNISLLGARCGNLL